MAYSWTDTILTAGSVMVKSAHVTELKTNINTERVARALAVYPSYTQSSAAGQKDLNADVTEMRLAADAAHTANVCVTHYTGHDGSNLATNYATNNGSHYPGYDGTHYPGNDGSHYPGYDAGYYPGYNATHKASYNPSK
jgi:hypothetical protein